MHTPKRKSGYLSRRRKKYLIEVHAEAYYRALKKIENEKHQLQKVAQSAPKQNEQSEKNSLFELHPIC